MCKTAIRIVRQLRIFYNTIKEQTLAILMAEPDTHAFTLRLLACGKANRYSGVLRLLNSLGVVPWDLCEACNVADGVASHIC